MQNSFNEKEASNLMNKGNNTISGQAFLRQLGGGIVTCAGYEVKLIPATKYAEERIRQLYVSNEQGANLYRHYAFTPDEPLYHNLIHKTICNKSGNFTFTHVSNGSFFIVAPVIWAARTKEGAWLMKKVTVTNNETKEVIVTNSPKEPAVILTVKGERKNISYTH